MALNQAIEITPDQRDTLVSLLFRHLPNTEAWVYGSRVRGACRPASDLDMVVFATPEQACEVSELRESFEESNLPFRVDLFVWDEVPESFREQIERDHVVITYSTMRETTFGSLLAQPVRNGIYKTKEFHGRGVKMVNMGELFAHPRLRNVSMKRVELNASEIDRFSVKKGDLLFARRSLVAEGAGKCCVVLEVSQPTAFESSIIRARPDPGKVDSLYIFYYFNSPLGLHRLDTIRKVAVAGITGGDLASLGVRLLPVHHQRAVAHVLGTLDDKIDLNRRMNETLEAMARAIFKDWFVDFGPTRAKAEGRAPYLAPELWDLFPDALDDEGKPVGWDQGILGDIAESPRRSTKPSDVSEETPYIGLEHMPRRSVALTEWESAAKVKSNKTHFRKGEILFGKLRPYFHKVGVAPLEGICSTDIVVVVPQAKEWEAFSLVCMSSDEFVDYASHTSTGTKMPRSSWKTMAQYKMCLPPEHVVSAFQNIARALLDRLGDNIQESSTLTRTRDLLLPKLMSGEIHLRIADRVNTTDTAAHRNTASRND